jgi:hypothetical protein
MVVLVNVFMGGIVRMLVPAFDGTGPRQSEQDESEA